MSKFEERESITFENQGQKIFGMLHRPLVKNEDKAPAVIMCHGFAGNKAGRYRIYVSMAEALAKMGIISLRFDFRGSGDSEGDFSDMTLEGEVSDAINGLEFLRKNKDVDPKRIGLLGNSFGGAVAVIAASRFGNVKSMALLAALYSSAQWRQQWELIQSKNPADAEARKQILDAHEGNMPGPTFYRSFFQMDLEPSLKKLSHIPLLHVHSMNDERIPLSEVDHYMRCRQNAKGLTRYIRLNNCDHSFSNAAERMMVVEETAKWFKDTL